MFVSTQIVAINIFIYTIANLLVGDTMKIQTTGMILLILTLSLLVYGCSEKQQEDKTIDNSTILNNTIIENNNTIIEKTNVSLSSNVVDSNNQFAFDLYSKYSSEEKNIFFSPFSISSAESAASSE